MLLNIKYFSLYSVNVQCEDFAPTLTFYYSSQSLINGRIDYVNISLYCATAMGTQLFKELQKVVYLGVKQIAFVEISERTFGHIHGLSYDWHVQKKLGDVLRSMDRGISSADTVVREEKT